MKCAYCGKNNKPGAVVCKRCGIGLPPPPPPEGDGSRGRDAAPDVAAPSAEAAAPETKKRSLLKTVIVVGAALAALLIIAGVIYAVAGSSSVILPSARGYTVHSDGVFFAGEVVAPDESGIFSAMSSLDGARAGMLCKNGCLYAGKKGVSSLVAKEVSCFTLSENGNQLVYMDSSNHLWSFDCSKDDSAPVCISTEAVESVFSVSPDGSTVVFNKKNDPALYMSLKGKVSTVGDGLIPISVSNAGKNIYCFSPAENSIYYTSRRGRATYLRSNIVRDVYVNSTHDEIVFSTDAGQGIIITMISVSGREPVEIRNSSDTVAPVLPVSCIEKKDVFDVHTVFTCPLKSFDGKLFAGSGLVKYSAKSGADVIVPGECGSAVATDDYGTVYFLSEGVLSRMVMKNTDGPQRMVDGCSDFAISTNGSTVWYVDKDGSLRYHKGAKDELIARNVDLFAASPNGKSAAFCSEGRIYLNIKGNPRRTTIVDEFFATGVAADAKGFYLRKPDGGWTKLVESGKKVDILN